MRWHKLAAVAPRKLERRESGQVAIEGRGRGPNIGNSRRIPVSSRVKLLIRLYIQKYDQIEDIHTNIFDIVGLGGDEGVGIGGENGGESVEDESRLFGRDLE